VYEQAATVAAYHASTMSNHDCNLLNYLRLAVTSTEKHQPLGRDRFLVLAGATACHAGLLDVAEKCRTLVLADNPHHMLGHYETFPEALRDDDFSALWKHLQKLCPPEQAEFLLQNLATDSSAREHPKRQQQVNSDVATATGTFRQATALLQQLQSDEP